MGLLASLQFLNEDFWIPVPETHNLIQLGLSQVESVQPLRHIFEVQVEEHNPSLRHFDGEV